MSSFAYVHEDEKLPENNQMTIEQKYDQDDKKLSRVDEMSLLFHKLDIHKYLKNFKKEEFKFRDLIDISTEDLKELIPTKGPRGRFQRWAAGTRQNSGFTKPVLMSMKSKSKMKPQIFPDKLHASLKSLAQKNATTKLAMAMVEEDSIYITELITRLKVDANKKKDAFLSHVQKHHADFCRSL